MIYKLNIRFISFMSLPAHLICFFLFCFVFSLKTLNLAQRYYSIASQALFLA